MFTTATSVDTKVNTPSADAYELEQTLTSQKNNITDTSSDVRSTGSSDSGELSGLTATSISLALKDSSSENDAVASEMERLSTAVNSFAEAMASIETRLRDARGRAIEAGLDVQGDIVHRPQPDEELSDFGKAQTFDEIDETVKGIRDEEKAAHETLQAACHEISTPPAIKTAKDARQAFSNAITWTNRGKQAADAVAGGLRMVYGEYDHSGGVPGKPRLRDLSLKNPKKAWEAWKSASAYKDRVTDLKNWKPKPGAEGKLGWKAASTAGKVLDKAKPWLKGAGILSSAAEGVEGAWDQYRSDSEKHPSMGEGEKKTRAVASGGGKALANYAAAAAGAKAGAVAGGMLGGPVGAAVGGIAGGVLGGLAGSKISDSVGKGAAGAASWVKKNLF